MSAFALTVLLFSDKKSSSEEMRTENYVNLSMVKQDDQLSVLSLDNNSEDAMTERSRDESQRPASSMSIEESIVEQDDQFVDAKKKKAGLFNVNFVGSDYVQNHYRK